MKIIVNEYRIYLSDDINDCITLTEKECKELQGVLNIQFPISTTVIKPSETSLHSSYPSNTNVNDTKYKNVNPIPIKPYEADVLNRMDASGEIHYAYL